MQPDSVFTTTEATSSCVELYFHVETKSEYFHRRADEAADLALRHGADGFVGTAEILAEQAELFAALGIVWRAIEHA